MKKVAPIRWTVELASKEFAINPRTLSKRIRQADVHAGVDGKFSTKQIVAALFGDVHAARQRLLESQTALLDQRLASVNGELLPVSTLTNFITNFFVSVRAELRTWKILESARMKFWFRLHDTFIEALKECGFDTAKMESAHQAEVKKFKADLAGGHIPDDWRDPLIPEEHGRIWSQALSRYYSKQEIIERFGESAVVSPIDHILDAANIPPLSHETRRAREKSNAAA